jgi:hypothetical protein
MATPSPTSEPIGKMELPLAFAPCCPLQGPTGKQPRIYLIRVAPCLLVRRFQLAGTHE